VIIVRLQGGLGNQMFQYAIGRRLSLHHNTELKLDLTALLDRTPRENVVYRNFELGAFDIQATVAPQSALKKYKWKDSKNRVYRRANYILRYPIQRLVKEKHFHFDEQAIRAPRNAYLTGYWQSYRYFQDIEEIIRSDFAFTEQMKLRYRSLSERAASSNSICLNVRRGDFVSNPAISKTHGVCEIDYFYRALDFVKARFQEPEILVFSDDIDWCRKNLGFGCPTLFMDFEGNSYEYLYLMSSCRHFIIPNSTFGWWAAWLSESPNKIVVVPKEWFTNPEIITSDLIPDKWHRI